MSGSEAQSGYYWIFVDHLRRRSTRRLFHRLRGAASESVGVGAAQDILAAILLVESRERPVGIRAIERAAQLLGSNRVTCGPLQLRGAPWPLEAGFEMAAERLSNIPREDGTPDWQRVAELWHGPNTDRTSGAVRYAEALALADRAVQESGSGSRKPWDDVRFS